MRGAAVGVAIGPRLLPAAALPAAVCVGGVVAPGSWLGDTGDGLTDAAGLVGTGEGTPGEAPTLGAGTAVAGTGVLAGAWVAAGTGT